MSRSGCELNLQRAYHRDTEAMRGASEAVVMRRACDEGERLWALLNTAKNLEGKFRYICQPAH